MYAESKPVPTGFSYDHTVSIAIILAVAVVYIGLPEYLKLMDLTIVPPVMFGFGLAGVLLIGLVYFNIVGARLHPKQGNWEVSPLVWLYIAWFLCFIVLALISLSLHGANSFSVEDLARRVSASTFFAILLIALSNERLSDLVLKGIALAGVGLAISVVLAFLQIAFITPGSCRMGGIYLNPNGSAYALLCSTWLGSQITSGARWRSLFQSTLLVAVALTMSRSAFIVGAIIVVSLVLQKRVEIVKVTAFSSVLILIILGAAWFQGQFEQKSCMRYAIADRMGIKLGKKPRISRPYDYRIGPSSELDDIDEAGIQLDPGGAQRIQYAKEAWERFSENVLLGSGIDREAGERAHNMMLSFLSQNGLLGLALFLAFWALITLSGFPVGLAVGLFAVSMFVHSFYYERYLLMTLACGVSASAVWRRQNDKSHSI